MPEHKRDWQKDWEICQQASPKPWEACEAEDGCGLVWSVPCGFPVLTTNTDSEVEGFRSSKDRKVRDAKFTAIARSALPYWLQRVKELEEMLQSCLLAANYALQRTDSAREEWQITHWKSPIPHKIEELSDAVTLLERLASRVRILEEENRRLRAVAEAARELRSAINDLLETPTTCYYAIHLACPVCGRPRQVWDGCNSAYREKSQGKCEYGGDPCVWAEAVIRVEKALAVLEEGGKQL